MTTLDFSAVGFLVLDVLGRPADEMPPAGGAIFVEEITTTVAGTAGGTAVDCALLGLKGRIVARVGRDSMGDYLISQMAEFGLNVDQVQRDDKYQTSASMLPIRTNGARSAFFVPGASRTFALDAEQSKAALDARFVHLGGTGLLDSFDGEPSVQFLRQARQLGRTTIFDLILADAGTIAKVEPLLPFIDYFVPSIEEASAMAGLENPETVAKWFKDHGVKNVILTLGEDGVYVDPEASEAFFLPAHAINVADTTGCGDSFTAGVITGLSKGWDIRECARFASATAALVAQGLGSQGALSSFDETLRAMHSMPLRGSG